MADQLTTQQRCAVENRGGRLLVSAAAGSGKTKVLVDRLLRYVTDPDDPADLDEFLMITYTKAAATELRGKIAKELTARIAQEPENRRLQKQMQRLFLTKISTVHGFCGDLLREYAYRLDIAADFRVADENECRQMRNNVLSDLLDQAYENPGPDFRAFADTQGIGRDDRLLPQLIEQVYDSARCHKNPEQWLEQCLENTNSEQIHDAAETTWGWYLLEDLHGYLDCQIQVMTQCALELERCEGLEKPAENFRQTIAHLQQLRQCQSWDAVWQNREIPYGRLTFPRKNPDEDLTDRVKAARDACKSGISKRLQYFTDDSKQVLQDVSQTAAATRGLIALVRQFDQAYTAAKRGARCLDFGDLEHKTLDLLLGKQRTQATTAAREIGRRYREILVDEYQDSNEVQDAIFTVLTEERQNCFLVGDVKQSIYQFRLAEPKIFLNKYEHYLPADQAQSGQGRKVLLSDNFRSGIEVIDGVNDVFRTCMSPQVGGLVYGEAEQLREGVPKGTLGEPGVELYAIASEEDAYAMEAEFVAQKIQSMLAQGTRIRSKDGSLVPVQPEDIVILLRSPGSAARYFQQALERRGLRCTSGSGMDLMKTQQISALRSLLQVVLNPRQDIPLIAALASPVFGFTADDLAQIRAGKKEGCLYDCLVDSQHPKAQAFLQILLPLRQQARLGSLTGLLEQCFAQTRMDSVFAAMPGGTARSASLQAFYQLAADFEQGKSRDLAQFLEHLDALEERGMTASGEAAAGCITIMSIHKSKGLEFPVVFLANLARKFNQENIRAQILCDKQLGLGLSVADAQERIRYPSAAKRAIEVKQTAESVSEEMRVLYVAMTRAKDRLIMTYATKYLKSDLEDIAQRMDFDDGQLLCREAICMGDWVLQTAMGKVEAGQLHAIGGRPRQLRTQERPWKIELIESVEEATAASAIQERQEQMPSGALETLHQTLAFQYPHLAATQAPSKRTATDRKGRLKDEEAAQEALEPQRTARTWRRPGTLSGRKGGKARGSATHLAMQYLRYEACGSQAQIAEEIHRLVAQGYLTQEQEQLISSAQLAAFFATGVGQKLRSGTPYLREFKFSILDDGANYAAGLEGEQVLLQGVVDCALLEPDGITVLDFKTDYVTKDTVLAVTQRYAEQVRTYAHALSRIYQMPIKAACLYFFSMGEFVPISWETI